MMFEEPIRVLPVATVGGPTRRLNVCNAVGLRTQNPEKGFRVHRARSNLDVIRLLNHAPSIAPIFLQLKDQVLKCRPFLNLTF